MNINIEEVMRWHSRLEDLKQNYINNFKTAIDELNNIGNNVLSLQLKYGISTVNKGIVELSSDICTAITSLSDFMYSQMMEYNVTNEEVEVQLRELIEVLNGGLDVGVLTAQGESGAASVVQEETVDAGGISDGGDARGSDVTVESLQVREPISSVTIPSNIDQMGYTVTCYGEGGWYLSGGSQATPIARSSNQRVVHDAWLNDGANYKDGIAVMNVDGETRYLVATAPSLGSVGDCVDVRLDNGQTIPCVIADSKNSMDANFTTYGHSSGGQVNVLEFEVDRNVFNQKGNPKTSTWGLEWDSSSDVRVVDNYGSII